MPKLNPDEVIANYLAAYRASGHEPSFRVSYSRGYVRFAYGSGTAEGTARRLSQLAEMTERLRARHEGSSAD